VTEDDGMQVDSIFIDQAKFGQAVRQVWASNFDLPVAFGLYPADRALETFLYELGVGADRLQRARDDPFRLVPPRRREGAFLRIPFRMVVVPVAHDLIHSAAVHTARLPLSFLDEVAKERGAGRERHMVDVPVQGLIHSEHELGHALFLFLRAGRASCGLTDLELSRAPHRARGTRGATGVAAATKPLRFEVVSHHDITLRVTTEKERMVTNWNEAMFDIERDCSGIAFPDSQPDYICPSGVSSLKKRRHQHVANSRAMPRLIDIDSVYLGWPRRPDARYSRLQSELAITDEAISQLGYERDQTWVGYLTKLLR
jgi:hypothetical protein